MYKGFLGSGVWLLAMLAIASCSGSPTKPSVEKPALAEPTDARRLWSSRMPGLITDLSVSKNGQAVLVSLVPDPEREGAQTGFHTSLFDRDGKLVWDRLQSSRVKSQAVADDASMAVFNTFDDRLSAFDASGKLAWSIEDACKPIVLSARHKVLCYHDDDAAPGVAFEILEWEGKRILSQKVTGDVLALKVSLDEQSVVVAATRGQIVGYGADFKPAVKKKILGEIIDLSIASGPTPRILVLSTRAGQGQRLIVMDWEGNLLSEARPPQQVEQVELAPDGKSFFAYGNGPRGQILVFYEFPVSEETRALSKDPITLLPKWSQGDPRHADFSSNLTTSHRRVIVGTEKLSARVRETRIQSYDFDGNSLWTVPIRTEEGSYLYSQAMGPEGSFLVVGTDDSYVSAFLSKAAQATLFPVPTPSPSSASEVAPVHIQPNPAFSQRPA